MRKLAILPVLLFLVAAASATAATTSYVIVTLVSQTPDPVEPGDLAELRFRLENNGSSTIKPIEVELLPQFPLSLQDAAIKGIGSIDARQSGADAVFVKYRVLVDSAADEGLHPVYLRYRIGDSSWTKVGPFNVAVRPAEAIVSVISAASTESMSAGKISDFVVQLKNYGKLPVKDVRAKLDLDSIPFAPIGSSNEKVIDNIAAGDVASAVFRLSVDGSADSGQYKTTLVLNYVDDSGRRHIRNSTIGLLVQNEPEFSVALKESKVRTPEASGEVVLSVSNTGPAEVRFMTARLLDSEGYKVISASEVYIGNLEADDFETAEFDIRTADIKPGILNLNAVLEYKDSFNRATSKTVSIPLRIYSKSEAQKLGLLAAKQNPLMTFLALGVQLIILVFVIFMLIDCWKNSLPKYKKVLWTIVILTGIGAVLYYFIARRRK